jgi:hypothetical protein
MTTYGYCAVCKKHDLVVPLHGDHGGPGVCLICSGKWHAEHGRRRRAGRIVIRALKAFEEAGGKPTDVEKLRITALGSDLFCIDPLGYLAGVANTADEVIELTSELLDDAIGLSHPDCHPPERQDLALCTTQKLLALKPFVFPAPQPKKPIPRDGSITPRAAGAEKTLRTLYPCAECASTIPYFYCTQCKTEWEKRREAERAKLREQRRKQYANRKRRRRAWRERLCEICGTKLEDSRRADIRFCSSACRQKGHRARVTDSRGRYRVTTMRRNAALDAISKGSAS